MLLSSVWYLASSISLYADFDDIGTGARPLGMGNAFVGLADDVRAIAYNPAGLAYLRRSEFTADYGRLFAGLGDSSNLSSGFVAFAQPISPRKTLDERVRDLRRITAIEAQIEISTETTIAKQKAESRISFFKDWGTLGLAFSNLSLSGVVSENIFYMSYGRKILERFSVGSSLKLLYESYTQDAYTQKDPVFDSGARSNLLKYSIDAGLLYNLFPKIFMGLALTDINRPNIALNPSDKEILPMGLKTGFAYEEKKVRAAVDTVLRDSRYRINAGGERWFRNRTYALRAGGGIGSADYKSFTYGMSVNWGNIQLDYAFIYPISGVRETYGSHKFSIVYRFGKAPVDELEPGSIELYYSKLQAEMEMLRARYEKAEDERSRLEKVLVDEALSRIKEKVRAEKLESTISAPAVKKELQRSIRSLPAVSGISATPNGMKTYVTSKGDTLQSISELFYGKKDRWMEIFNLNKDKVGRGGNLKSGTVLLIPGAIGAAPSTEELLLPAEGRTLAPTQIAPSKITEPSSVQESSAPLPEGTTMAPVKPSTEKSKKKAEPKKEEPARPKTYTVQPGDTLSSIAEKIYGNSKRWKEIYTANKDKVERGSVAPGQVLAIP